MSARLYCVGLAIAASAVLAGEARAGTVAVRGDRIVFTAAAGEVNNVTVGTYHDVWAVPDGPVVTVRDDGAPISAGAGCQAVDSSSVTCDDLTHRLVELRLGDGDDTATTADYFVVGHPLAIYGGDGDDRISAFSGGGAMSAPLLDGGRGDDQISSAFNYGGGVDQEGGPGDDVLSAWEAGSPSRLAGGPGDDTISYQGFIDASAGNVQLVGGSGDDYFNVANPSYPGLDPSHIAGGHGFDTLDVSNSPSGTGITLDLAACPSCSLEKVIGTSFDDVLLGDSGNNVFVGGAGNDIIDPRGGRDQVDAGAGDDVLTTRDGRQDTVTCGDGADTLTADRHDIVAADCESVDIPPRR